MGKQNIEFKKIYSEENLMIGKLIEVYEYVLNEIKNTYMEVNDESKIKNVSEEY